MTGFLNEIDPEFAPDVQHAHAAWWVLLLHLVGLVAFWGGVGWWLSGEAK